jgi:hypothetical protein
MKILDTQLAPLLKFLDGYFAKAPALPTGGKDFLVSVAPWLAVVFGVLGLIFGVMGLFAILGVAALGMGAVGVSGAYGMPAAGAYAANVAGFSILAIVAIAFALLGSLLQVLAFPGLKARKVKGWNLMLYVFLLSVVSSVLTLQVFAIAWAVVWFLVSYYFLYQVKSYYK